MKKFSKDQRKQKIRQKGQLLKLLWWLPLTSILHFNFELREGSNFSALISTFPHQLKEQKLSPCPTSNKLPVAGAEGGSHKDRRTSCIVANAEQHRPVQGRRWPVAHDVKLLFLKTNTFQSHQSGWDRSFAPPVPLKALRRVYIWGPLKLRLNVCHLNTRGDSFLAWKVHQVQKC